MNWTEAGAQPVVTRLQHCYISCHVPLRVDIINVTPGEVVPHKLLLITGRLVRPTCVLPCHISATVNTHQSACTKWLVNRQGVFKVLVWLELGANTISLSIEVASYNLKVTYQPLQLTRFVRPIFLLCRDSDGTFQCHPNDTRVDNSLKSALKRVSLAVHMLQMYVAEQMVRGGFGRRTFCIDPVADDGEDGSTLCTRVFRSKLSEREARAMPAGELWKLFGRELMSSEEFGGKCRCKWLVLMSFTRYRLRNGVVPGTHGEVLANTSGHAALGGGGLALFGSGCLHTWPQHLAQVPHAFTDDTTVDRRILMDDSANRGTYGTCYTTTLGAVLHELGHTLDMGHTPYGIMDRGFDHINHFFTINQTSTVKSLADVRSDKAVWYVSSLLLLRYHKWLNEHSSSGSDTAAAAQPIQLSDSGIVSQQPLVLVEYRDPSGTTFYYDDCTARADSGQCGEVRTYRLRQFTGRPHFTVLACDNRGNIVKRDIAAKTSNKPGITTAGKR